MFCDGYGVAVKVGEGAEPNVNKDYVTHVVGARKVHGSFRLGPKISGWNSFLVKSIHFSVFSSIYPHTLLFLGLRYFLSISNIFSYKLQTK